jgi:hypothetical protein
MTYERSNYLADLDGAWLVAFGPRHEYSEHTIPIFRPDRIRIDLDRKSQCPVKLPRHALSSVNADIRLV